MEKVITVKYGSGKMEIDLNELFYYDESEEPSDWQNIHYSKLQRITKLFKFFYQVSWNNTESLKQCMEWLEEEKGKWKRFLKTSSDNLGCQRVGSSGYRQYKREVASCNRFMKLFDTAIRILDEGK